MRIGILTFHCAHNYGAVIQCYGLQQYLKSLGHQVFVIDYRPSYFDFYQLPKPTYGKLGNLTLYIKSKFKYSLMSRINRMRHKAFEDFITQKLSIISYMPQDDYSDYDAIILGSDQIWNPKITGGQYDEVFFGSNAKCRVISYAASSRSAQLTDEQQQYLKLRLNHIDAISVRETSLCELLQPLLDKPIATVIDPSFLPNVIEYERLCEPIKQSKPYVLVYEVERNPDTSRIADEIAQSLNADVVELVSCTSPKFCGKRFRQTSGPTDFLSYIKNAECIVTTSFHGMALSLKFQKNFYSIRQGNNADLRAESLLSKIGLLDRFISLKSSVTYSTIDYALCLPKLNVEINQSKEFLSKALRYDS